MNADSRLKPITYEASRVQAPRKDLYKRIVGFFGSLVLLLMLEFFVMKLIFAHA